MSRVRLYYSNIGCWLLLLFGLVSCAPGGISFSHTSGTNTTPAGSNSSSPPGSVPTTVNRIEHILVPLEDRSLTITHVQRKDDSDATTREISVTLLLKNTGRQPLANHASYFRLVTTEGDTFGQQIATSAHFDSSIGVGETFSGTITFSVPISVNARLRLLYHAEQSTQTALVPLNI